MRPAISMSVPPAPDFAERLSSLLRMALEKSGWRFSCENSEFTSEEVVAPDGMLPMWLNKAQAWMAQGLGGHAGPMTYRIDATSLCGVHPAPQGETASLAVWACFTHFALEHHYLQHKELVAKGQPVPMDDLYKEWHSAIRMNRVPLLPPEAAPEPGFLAQPQMTAQSRDGGING